jgi:hypothetical protein
LVCHKTKAGARRWPSHWTGQDRVNHLAIKSERLGEPDAWRGQAECLVSGVLLVYRQNFWVPRLLLKAELDYLLVWPQNQ